MAQNLEVIELPIGWGRLPELVRITKRGKKPRVLLSPTLVKLMLGGKWPEFNGFDFDAVHSYLLEKDGTLTPMDSDFGGEPAPGPNFKLTMVDDVFSDPPELTSL